MKAFFTDFCKGEIGIPARHIKQKNFAIDLTYFPSRTWNGIPYFINLRDTAHILNYYSTHILLKNI
jgi:hypothetical protein